jgi:serine/threonine protein phosphatase 1
MSDDAEAAPLAPGLTFAIADLHGRFDLLQDALVEIERYPAGAVGRTVVFLGDYIDRGPQGAEVIERLVLGPPPGWRWICLKGNHEAMMAIALQNPDQIDWWIGNGGDATIRSYQPHRELMAAHLAWVQALPTLHVDAHRVFVHGGVDPAIPLDRQPDKTLLWKRYPRDAGEGHGDLHVVHGHDPNEDGPLRHPGRTDLDTLAWATGRLVVGVFDDARPGGPIDLIELRRRPAL